MTYVLYPPQPAVKQLTAKAAIDNFGDHFQAFLNANNIASWKPEDGYVLSNDKISDILVTLGNAKGMTIAQIKHHARRINKLMKTSRAKHARSQSLDMVVNCLGYKRFQFAYMCRSVDHYVDNLWPTEMTITGQLLNATDLREWVSSSLPDELRTRIQFNLQRAKVTREVESADRDHPTERTTEFLRTEKYKLKRRATAPVDFRDE